MFETKMEWGEFEFRGPTLAPSSDWNANCVKDI